MEPTLHAMPATYPAQGHSTGMTSHERRGMDESRWSLLRLLLAAMLTIAVLAAATGLAA